MKLSMWILQDWLKTYEPIPYIQEGKRILCNVRLFSANSKLLPHTVYLNQESQDRVLCVNGHDILMLNAKDAEEVFNVILDAFDFYNEWENQLQHLIDTRCSLQELLAHIHIILPRALGISDPSYYITHLFGEEEMMRLNATFRSVCENRSLGLDTIFRVNQDERIRKQNSDTFLIEDADYSFLGAVSNLFCRGYFLGWLVTGNPENLFTQGDLNLQDSAVEGIQKWLENNPSYQERMKQSGVLLDLLQGEIDLNRVYLRLSSFGWKQEDELQVYVIRTADPASHSEHILERLLRALDDSLLLLKYGEDYLILRNMSLSKVIDFEQNLTDILEKCKCSIGKSNTFEDVKNLKKHYISAGIALDYGSYLNKKFIDVNQITLYYTKALIQQNTAINVLHPALSMLKVYDLCHNTKYKETLRVFTDCCFHIANTAKALHLHRSTLLYRLEKIQEMTDIDYHDNHTQMHLMLSFFLEEGLPTDQDLQDQPL